MYAEWFFTYNLNQNIIVYFLSCCLYEGESIKKKQPNLFLGEIDLIFFDVIAL